MIKNYEYNQNLAITNEDTYNALVSHFNQIQEFSNNKKFEWEDESIPEENYNIIFDFDEWLETGLKTCKVYSSLENDDLKEDENLKEDMINYVNQIKDYIDGFLLESHALYNRKSFLTESYSVVGDYFDEIVRYMKELKKNNKMVFLYYIRKTTPRPNQDIIETKTGKITYPTIYSVGYKIGYGVVNDL
jgi:hypothetical protein